MTSPTGYYLTYFNRNLLYSASLAEESDSNFPVGLWMLSNFYQNIIMTRGGTDSLSQDINVVSEVNYGFVCPSAEFRPIIISDADVSLVTRSDVSPPAEYFTCFSRPQSCDQCWSITCTRSATQTFTVHHRPVLPVWFMVIWQKNTLSFGLQNTCFWIIESYLWLVL